MKLKIIPGQENQNSEEFHQGMIDRMYTGNLKYGDIRSTFPHTTDALACVQLRIQKYRETGNTEWLIDAANMLMIEFMLPAHPNAHYRPTESHESPGGIRRDGTIFDRNIDPRHRYKREGD